MKVLIYIFVIFSIQSLFAQNTLQLPENYLAPEASIELFSWIQGSWTGSAFGGTAEEIWSAPNGGSMMCSFRLIIEGQVQFYELCILREVEHTVLLQLKHFDKRLIGWETKEETVDFPLVKLEENRAYFAGFTIEKVDEDHINMYVMIGDDGKEQEMLFAYTRKKE